MLGYHVVLSLSRIGMRASPPSTESLLGSPKSFPLTPCSGPSLPAWAVLPAMALRALRTAPNQGMARAWRDHGEGMARPWGEHGEGMGRAW